MHRRILGGRLVRSRLWTASGLVAVGASLALSGGSIEARDGAEAATSPRPALRMGANAAPALILRRDSGHEQEGLLSETLPEALSTSGAGLVEKPGVTEAGGVMVGLNGRFRTALVLERQADGSTTTRCISNLPSAASGER